jgi:Arc/MetJ-type ribon-helix-helix transcriptional regulator
MQQITVKLPEDTAESLSNVAESQFDDNRSEAIRELLQRGIEYEDLEDDLEQAHARIEDLRRQLQATNAREEDIGEVVEYVEEERGIQRRREERSQAPAWRRAWWWVVGTPERRGVE